MTFLNLHYPDSSVVFSVADGYVNPHSRAYIGNTVQLKELPGLTLMFFDYSYFERRVRPGEGVPYSELDPDSLLGRYVLTNQELDSLGWTIVYSDQ
jgi:hypothetical protein